MSILIYKYKVVNGWERIKFLFIDWHLDGLSNTIRQTIEDKNKNWF